MIPTDALLAWCRIPADELSDAAGRRLPLRIVADRATMGRLMADELLDGIRTARADGRRFRTIIPCGPSSWYEPFTSTVVAEGLALDHVEVFHMDECLDWQGRVLPRDHPYSFRGSMERHFYGPVPTDLAIPEAQRHWLEPDTMNDVAARIAEAPVDLALGGWGQDGHVAYNQASRHPLARPSLDQLRDSTIRIQENNVDTIIALGQRALGAAYQLVPPMSVTLGMREILAAHRVRLFSDTGSWKQTALRVALFSPPDPDYPITLLQEHPDAVLTATRETADHPIARHPEWVFG